MSYLISSSIVNVDVSLLSKIVQLPPASTVLGKTFLVRDSTGTSGFPNTINVITSGIDTVDYTTIIPVTNPIELASPYESIRLIAQSTTNYAVLSRSFNNTWPPP
jgi:hypothetical protein